MSRRAVVSTIVAALLLAGSAVALSYRGPLVSWATHWKGGPSTTWVVPTYPPGDLPDLRLAVAGDTGDGGPEQERTADAIARIAAAAGAPYDGLLLLGDCVYPAGDPAQVRRRVRDPFADVLDTGTPLLAVLGNHDVKQGHGDEMAEALGMPGRWWSKRYGEVLLVGLDSTQHRSAAQRAWLERTLAESDARWRIVALHHPPYSAGYQGSSMAARRAFAPLFERYGVQLVLSGHDHDYQRSVAINGVTYIVSGAGAGTRRTGTADYTAVAYATRHFVEVDVFSDRLEVRAIDDAARMFDRLTLRLPPS